MLMRRITDEQWNDAIDINLTGTFLMTRAFVESMRRSKWGRIINTPLSGLVGNKGQANYSASKAGVIGFTRTISKELGNRNITANAICPGFVDTDMTRVLELSIFRPLGSHSRWSHWSSEDIANAVLFFASPDSSYVTGQVLTVDGGLIM